ncbi:MAG TPA: LysM peptidoglycan-binding domain-containing protein, partial [Geobacteraceae bacterium]|nr:LysM peptidoglycan-binding domain-containing protein [Geobacteraceae bacterium]
PADQRYTEKVLYTRYRARKRDTLPSVARRFGTTPQALAELNHLGKGARLKGRLLAVPVKGAPQEERVTEARPRSDKRMQDGKEFNKYYTVKRGDTLASLAKRFNVSAKFLAAWNKLKERVALRPGRRIIVAKYVEKKGGMTPVVEGKG